MHEDLLGRALQLHDRLGLQHLARLRRVDAHPAEDLELLVPARVRHVDLDQEPVPLCLGQRVDALGLDRVLGRDHDERLRHREGLAADRHLPLGHQLQHRRLDLGRRAVHLVGEDEVHEGRAELDVERLAGLPVDPGADDVGRHQVGSELDPGERTADHRGEGAHGQRLGDARNTLEQAVPLGE